MNRKQKLVKKLADFLGVDFNPVNQIYELEDSPDKCYVWSVDMTEEQIAEFTNNVKSTFVKQYNKDPDSLHFVRNDINDITELDPDEVKQKVKPWLDSQ